MNFAGWDIYPEYALPILVAIVVALAVRRRATRWARTPVGRAARRLGGRLDPLSASARFPAVLVELDGHLVRATVWPAGSEGAAGQRPFLELTTPVEGVASRLVVVRRESVGCLAPLVERALPRRSPLELGTSDLVVFGSHPAAWAPRLFAGHASWAALELDERMLRVLTREPGAPDFGPEAVEGAIRDFCSAIPEVLEAAGVKRSAEKQ